MNPQMQNPEPMLKESIKHFLASYQNGSSDFSTFESIFFRLIQTMLDPPLEITWFYSAIACHGAKLSQQKNDPSTKLLIAKDLLNLLISCSNLSSAPKKIALLAPVVCELYYIVCDFVKDGLCVEPEVEKLVDNMISYVIMSAGLYDNGNGVIEVDSLVVCYEDLVRVWTADRGGWSCTFGENLRIFFPVLNDGIWKARNTGSGLQELVGIVLCEVLFLKLFLGFRSGKCVEDLLEDTQKQVVQAMNGFQNYFFIDLLFQMLLEPRLPLAALLRSEDAVLLRKALYDAVMLFDYSLYAGRWVQLADTRTKELTLLWTLVADRAIQFSRTTSDQERAHLYLNAFFDSEMVHELIKWAGIQAESIDRNNKPEVSTPAALMKWFLILEDQGIRIFDHSTSKFHAKEVICRSNAEDGCPELHLSEEYKNQDNRLDANKDLEMSDQSNEIPVLNMANTRIDARRKRKESLNDLQQSAVKHVKLEYFGNSTGKELSPFSGNKGLHYGTGVKNIASDDDMEIVG